MSLAADLTFPKSFVWGDLAAVSRADVGAAQRHFSDTHRRDSILGDPGTEFIWGGGRLTHAWPSNPSDNQYSRVQTSKVPTLLIGGNLDGATPSQAATDELLPHLPNGHQVVLSDLGHTTDFWSYEPGASSHLVNTFLSTGKVDSSRYTHRTIDFAPGVTQTVIAKGLLAGMLGLATITAFSLLWLPWRVRRNGGFGRKASAVLRSLYPVVLGLGGWFAGALIVLTTMPTVPLDDELLVVLSIGAPIGLGIYWAWVRRDAAVRVRTAGFVVAAAGALVGCVARVPRDNRTPGPHHRDRRSCGRREPDGDRLRHRARALGPRPPRGDNDATRALARGGLSVTEGIATGAKLTLVDEGQLISYEVLRRTCRCTPPAARWSERSTTSSLRPSSTSSTGS